MKRFILIFSLIWALPVFGGAPIGQTVSDMKTHQFLTNLIKNTNSQIELSRQQYFDWLDKAQELKKNYNRLRSSLNIINEFQQTLLNNPTALGDKWFGSELRKLGSDIKSLTENTYIYNPGVDFKRLVQDTGKIKIDLTPTERSKYITHKNRIKSVVNERKFQDTITTTNEILKVQGLDGSTGFRAQKTETLHELATAAAGAENLKDSSEITNALLCQILDTLNTTLFMQALTFNASISALTGSRSQETLDSEIQNAQDNIKKVLKTAYLRKETNK